MPQLPAVVLVTFFKICNAGEQYTKEHGEAHFEKKRVLYHYTIGNLVFKLYVNFSRDFFSLNKK